MCARPKRAPFEVSTTARVLARLRASEGFVSGETISRELGLSRVAIWKHVHTLRTQGCSIDACRHRGYRLRGDPDLPTAEAVGASLHTTSVGRSLLFFREVDSTNHQLAMREAGAAEGLVLVADRQTAGRGRMGRMWFSPAGVNVYLSVLLRPRVSLAQVATLPLAMGCVAARALQQVAPNVRVKIKWPNDLYVEGRKLGGILCELVAETDGVRHVVAGIGVNVNLRRNQMPSAIARTATSLAVETRRVHARAAIVAELLNQLEPAYQAWCAEGLDPFLPEIAARDMLKGRLTCVQLNSHRRIEGVAEGVNLDGTLRLRRADGTREDVSSGDAHIVPATKKPAATRSAPSAGK